MLAVVTILIIYVLWTLERPLPTVSPTIDRTALTAMAPAGSLKWPGQYQAAVSAAGSSTMETHGKQQPAPTASTAKMITSLVVLEQKPLSPGEKGPTVTLTANDVNIYKNYVARDGSLVPVKAGEKISEYQMLQTVLLPSANNMADSLAIWAFGSLKNYQQAANQYLEDNGLVETHVGSDASGFNPSTTSTAEDLVRIGKLVMQSPVLKQIVGQASASGIPVVNNIRNVNFLLGQDHVIGVKTGNTDQAKGVFVSASLITVNNKPATIVTALMGSPTIYTALGDSVPLIKSAQTNFKPVTVVKKGSVVGSYQQPWGGSIYAVNTKDLSLDAWGGSRITAKTHLQNITPRNRSGQVVGNVFIPKSANNNEISAPVKLQDTPLGASPWWRLTHPL
jgi:D-alanyl-D-alanine carboxypeptidase (penicillin-binding protein 5/6)